MTILNTFTKGKGFKAAWKFLRHYGSFFSIVYLIKYNGWLHIESMSIFIQAVAIVLCSWMGGKGLEKIEGLLARGNKENPKDVVNDVLGAASAFAVATIWPTEFMNYVSAGFISMIGILIAIFFLKRVKSVRVFNLFYWKRKAK